MCGRYVLSLRPSAVRERLADQDMPSDEAPADDDERVRQSYNFAPGYHGLIYRAATSERGTDASPLEGDDSRRSDDGEPSPKRAKLSSSAAAAAAAATTVKASVDGRATHDTKYKLQAARWGLIPFWTKRAPNYGSMLRTINCRDDSLAAGGGMWATMKQRKRCIVVAEGFYEWLKKNEGRDRLPHYTHRADGTLMCFAGLWDCVRYEGSDEPIYTYTVITTDSNPTLRFLHDRMPVILEPGSEAMRLWLDPTNVGWSKELQSMLKPFEGELECYQVDKAVGKVGNNSPSFVVPIDSKENKKSIAHFFGVQREKGEEENKHDVKIKKEDDEKRVTTTKVDVTDSNAPLPRPKSESDQDLSQAINKDTSELDDDSMIDAANKQTSQKIKEDVSALPDSDLYDAEKRSPKKINQYFTPSPKKAAAVGKKTQKDRASPLSKRSAK